MSQELTVFQENTGLELAPEFMPMVADGLADDLSEGVGGGFAVVSARGGKFRIKYKGNEIPITDAKGDPVGSLPVVIVRANPAITKQWFSKPFEDNDSAPPDCFSLDGVVPSPTSPNIQSRSCATCPKNVFGSAPPRDGLASKGKACADNRKLAIVPLDDIDNEQFGGPMLFRVSATALGDLAQFGAAWKARGYPYNAIGVRLGLDINVSYPKATFKAIRPLTSEEAQKVLALVHSPAVEKILVDHDGAAAAADAPNPAVEEFEVKQPAPVVAKPAPAPKPAAPAPVATLMPRTAPPAAQAPAPASTATFGKPKPVAAPAAPQAAPAPVAAKPVAAKPKPAKPAPPPVVTQEPAEEEAQQEPGGSGELEDDIESILKDLNATA